MDKHNYEIIMPMAGLGSRFRSQGNKTVKPLIEYKNKPLFIHSLQSLSPILKDSRVSFIICSEDKISQQVTEIAKKTGINFQIIEIEQRTKGPAETVSKSQSYINNQLPLLSIDCDFIFTSKKYFTAIKEYPKTVSGGYLCYFQSKNSRFSYLQTDANDNVISIAEKNVISEKAVIGAYYFNNGDLLFESINKVISSSKEIFLSHAIQEILLNEKRFTCFAADEYASLGTPEEIQNLP